MYVLNNYIFMDKDQKMRYSKKELEMLKVMFKNNEENLYALRNHFWQFESKLPQFTDEQLVLLKKIFLPDNTSDVPIFQQVSMYQSLYKIREMSPMQGVLFIQANDILIRYMDQQFARLANNDVEELIILERLPDEGKGSDQEELRFVNILAYHNIGAYIEGRIQEIKTIVEQPEPESIEEKQKKLTKNSSK